MWCVGITGWVQINGHNAIDWEKKLKLDVWSVDSRIIWFNLNILWVAMWKILRREGVSVDGEVAVRQFYGKKRN